MSDTAGTELDGSSSGIPVGASDMVPVRVLCSQVLLSRGTFSKRLDSFSFHFFFERRNLMWKGSLFGPAFSLLFSMHRLRVDFRPTLLFFVF